MNGDSAWCLGSFNQYPMCSPMCTTVPIPTIVGTSCGPTLSFELESGITIIVQTKNCFGMRFDARSKLCRKCFGVKPKTGHSVTTK